MTSTLLCETVTGRTTAELIAARDRASDGDLVELRVDGVADLDLGAALAGRRRPVIVTCRPEWEGGQYRGEEDVRRRLLERALALGAEHVDVEWGARFDALVAAAPERVVVSHHDFTGVPADLSDRVRAMRQTGARYIKIAVTAARLTDTLPLLAVGRDGGAIVIGMGGPGLATRLLASRFGSVWTYAGNGHALGQVPAWEMVHRFRFRRIGCGTAIYGVVSRTARHSLSPALHNAAFEAAGMDAVYLPLEAADFDDFLTFADALGLAGASVTIPFKVDALRAAAAADRTASAVGAANTLRRAPTGWEATNTDVDGFLEPLDAVWPGGLAGVRVSVLGAGGAARAVVVALVARGAAVTVHARRDMQARALAALGARVGSWPPEPRGWDLLVNATSVGGAAARDESPLPGGPFDGRLVYDLTYGPGTSRLLREAQAAGCRTLDGLPMLVAQAERQFEWWTGRRPAAGVMAAAVAH